MHATTRITAVALTALGMATATPVLAQGNAGAAQQNNSSQGASQAQHFSKSQLQKFVKAQSKVQDVRSQWTNKIKNAKNKQKATSARRQAIQQMIQAVRSSGMSVSQYNEIAKAAQHNPKLAKRILKMS